MPNPNFSYISQFERAADWTPVGSTVLANDTTNFVQGSSGVKMTLPESGTSGTMYFTSPIDDLSNYNLGIRYYISNITRFRSLKIDIFSGDWENEFYAPAMSTNIEGWNYQSFTKTAFTPNNSLDWTDILYIQITVYCVTEGEPVSVTFDDFRAVSVAYKPTVTLRFDDGNSDLMTAKQYMDIYGYTGDAFIVTSWVGTTNFATLNQLKQLYDDGWDIGSHTVDHSPATTLTPAQAEMEFYQSQQYLINNGFVRGSNLIVYPQEATNATYDAIAHKYYAGIFKYDQSGVALGTFDNFWFPQNMTKMTDIVFSDGAGNITPIADLETQIDNLVADNGYTTIMVHEVTVPTDTTTFSTLLAYLYANGVQVITYSQLMNNLS